MIKPKLTVDHLIAGGFRSAGCWKLDGAGALHHEMELPRNGGVYAFAIDGIVQYVGLASKSISQRLNFYRKPGASQVTNVRLNEIISQVLQSGSTVEVLTACPPDQHWNGFRIKGAEGLEAGIIESFDVPWNIRGVTTRVSAGTKSANGGQGRRRVGGIRGKVLELIQRRPGMTELDIARAIHGPAAVQQQVNPVCRELVAAGLVERRGQGHSDPFIYYPKPI
jgi:hypothetical protein